MLFNKGTDRQAVLYPYDAQHQAIQRKELLTHAMTWVNGENVGERNQAL